MQRPVIKNRFVRITVKSVLWLIGSLLALLLLSLLAFVIYYNVAVHIATPRNVRQPSISRLAITSTSDGTRLGNNWLRHGQDGLWELYIEGDPMERGVAFGRLCSGLLYYQESVFMKQIDVLVPNRSYQNVLKYLIRFYNRDITDYIPEENLEEIYGMSQACSHQFDYVGSPYERQLNFHAAHDLGHAMQDYMLVGCTSFAAWGDRSADGDLIVGRNFDFYVGDDFARNKLVTFVNPTHGYKFAMVGWAGMTGVCSGMNEKGLTVTINAAKSSMPGSSATPISLLARRILQYAGTIAEAKRIADTTRTFVSESLLIGSGSENRAAIIEKSVERTALYEAPHHQHWLVCANHYQSAAFAHDERNLDNIRTSDSPYRQQRATELLEQNFPIDYHKAVSILRNPYGLHDAHIGLGNEKALNQFIGHHSVVFSPRRQLMWVSTSPWQEGAYVAFDLHKVFSSHGSARHGGEVSSLTVAADSAFLRSPDFVNFLRFRAMEKTLKAHAATVSPAQLRQFIALNPHYYRAYEEAGDICHQQGIDAQARRYWSTALRMDLPKQMDRDRITRKLKKTE